MSSSSDIIPAEVERLQGIAARQSLQLGGTSTDPLVRIIFGNAGTGMAHGPLLAQMLGTSMSGARGPLATQSGFEQLMERLGGRSEWTGKLGTRVLPANVSIVDDPTAKQFGGQDLLGTYAVDEEGVKAERVQVIDNGILRDLLMSRRPGPDLMRSNGHGRAAYLADARPLVSNLFFSSTAAESPADLKKKFLDTCKQNGNKWCLLVRAMDNPVLGVREQDNLSEIVMGAASGAASGDAERSAP